VNYPPVSDEELRHYLLTLNDSIMQLHERIRKLERVTRKLWRASNAKMGTRHR